MWVEHRRRNRQPWWDRRHRHRLPPWCSSSLIIVPVGPRRLVPRSWFQYPLRTRRLRWRRRIRPIINSKIATTPIGSPISTRANRCLSRPLVPTKIVWSIAARFSSSSKCHHRLIITSWIRVLCRRTRPCPRHNRIIRVGTCSWLHRRPRTRRCTIFPRWPIITSISWRRRLPRSLCSNSSISSNSSSSICSISCFNSSRFKWFQQPPP